MRLVPALAALLLPILAGCVSSVETVSVAPAPATSTAEPQAVPPVEAKIASSTSAIAKAAPAPAGSPAPQPEVPPAASTEQPVAVPEVVINSQSLSGFWKVTGPKFIDISMGVLSGVHIQYSADTDDRDICMIDDRAGHLTGVCSAGNPRPATGDRDGDRVVLRWWNGPVNVIFSGDLDGSGTIRGGLSGGVVGLRVTGRVPLLLTRMEPPPDDAEKPASEPLVRAVLEDIEAGKLTPGRYGPEAIRHLQPAIDRLHAMEAPAKVTYLGQIHIRWQRKQAEKVQDVYKVGIAAGQELCRIMPGDHGTVADFDCRALDI